MANMQVKNAAGTTVYVKATGAGTNDDPHIVTQAVEGVATQTTLAALSAKVTACDTGAVVIASALPAGSNAIGSVTVSNFPATQPVSGTVSVGNFPSSQAVTGTFWQATQPVSLASLPTLPTGTNSIGNIGTVSTVSAVTAITNALPAGSAILGKVGIDQTTPGTTNLVQVGGSLPAGSNAIGSVTVSNLPATQAVSLASLPALTTSTADVGKVDASGTKVTAAAMPTGGVGFLGWLSAVWYQLTQPTPAGTNAIGSVGVNAGATGGATPYHLRSAATNNATSLKASAGTLYGWHVTNNNTTTCYRVKFYNKASAPSPASDTPVYVLTIPAAASASQPTVVQESGQAAGIAFGTGIAFAVVAGGSDADNTAVTTIGDVDLNLKYA
jgi:hypothetical protein